jgi:hypothetical protein
MSKFQFNKDQLEHLLPNVPWDAFKDLKKGDVITGEVESVSSFDGRISAYVAVDGHTMKVPLYGHDMPQAKTLIGTTVKVVYNGQNEDKPEYPKLFIKH